MEEKKKNSFPYTESGHDEAYEFSRVYDEEEKRFILKQTAKFSMQERIQSNSNLSDIAILKDRYARLGEVPQLPENGVNGIDTGLIPSNIHELNKVILSAGDGYDKLPADLQALYGSKQGYVDAVISGTASGVIAQYVNGLSKQNEKTEGEE